MTHRLIARIPIALLPLLTVACGETHNPIAPARPVRQRPRSLHQHLSAAR